jgi:TatD DNase family protein
MPTISNFEFIDTHAHLHGEEFASDFSEVIERAKNCGICNIVLIGEDIGNSLSALSHASGNPFFRVVAGVHPHRADTWNEIVEAQLREIGQRPEVVGIGETGLDYHYDFASREAQMRAFLGQLSIASELGKPVVIHCREAYDEMLSVTAEFRHNRKTPDSFGILHCYFGDVSQAKTALEYGYLLGIGGACTFKRAEELHQVIRETPLEKMVLETDSPYMTPVPYRGKRNESSYVPLIAARIAELKGTTVQEVAEVTTAAARNIFML